MGTSPAASSDGAAVGRISVDRPTLVRIVLITGLLALAVFPLPQFFGNDWVFTFTSVAIYSVVALGFGLLYGRVGMISLGQVALLTIGCWMGPRGAAPP